MELHGWRPPLHAESTACRYWKIKQIFSWLQVNKRIRTRNDHYPSTFHGGVHVATIPT